MPGIVPGRKTQRPDHGPGSPPSRAFGPAAAGRAHAVRRSRRAAPRGVRRSRLPARLGTYGYAGGRATGRPLLVLGTGPWRGLTGTLRRRPQRAASGAIL